MAYRYFATPRRSFILADCPGHVQYTRNTVTGSSTADVIVLLVDIRHGVLEQTRRHLAVASLLRVPHVVIAVNKIDLVDYAEATFRAVEADIRHVANGLGLTEVTVIPVSALVGDNIAERSAATSWYAGPSLLEVLEELPTGDDPRHQPLRFPVQYVIRPQSGAVDATHREYRGYAGRIAAGVVRPGDEIVVLPSGKRSRVAGIDLADQELDEAFAPQSVTLRLTDEIDIARGDLIASAQDRPTPTRDLDALVCWLAERPLVEGARVLVKNGARTVQAIVRSIDARLDLDTLVGRPTERLELNDIGRVRLHLAADLPTEPYARARHTGAFLLVDPQQAGTLAAGMVVSADPDSGNDTDWVI
ncbi:Bifunctional enzyme CysN/CysC [bioreactor metagenome]|uniref:sulfate adenylyltransferase n=1 Tax=bioreactor metagenome TaxID=1076179 RepID=A0A645BZ49_9ZZZZ